MSDKLDGEGSPMKPPRGASGVSAADKYAELKARGEERPTCACHGKTKIWAKNSRRPQGGYWICAEKSRLFKAGYRAANPERARALDRAWTAANPERMRAKDRRRITRLLDAGICTRCRREPLATADGWKCNACLDKQLTPEKNLLKRRRDALRRLARAQERHQTEGGIKLG